MRILKLATTGVRGLRDATWTLEPDRGGGGHAVVVTLGSAGDAPFVPGVPVGTVRQVVSTPGSLTRTVLVTPYVDATSVDTVAVVVQPPRHDPRNAMVPGGSG